MFNRISTRRGSDFGRISVSSAFYGPCSHLLKSWRLRQSLAPDLFLGAYQKDQLVGYICSTLSPDTSLSHDSMSVHIPGSPSVCIHSVCVSSAVRGQGVGLKLLREYIARLETASASYERVLLITHENLRKFYEKAGFQWLGPSAVVHGSLPWYEMRIIFGSKSPPKGVYEALQRPSNNNPAPRLLGSFPGGIPDVSSVEAGVQLNKFDLLCPRSNCGSVILKHGVAKLVEAASVQVRLSLQAVSVLTSA